MGTDWKQKAKELADQGKQYYGSMQSYKEKYEKLKDLYELGKQLIDPDTRDSTIFKKSLDLFISIGGKLLGSDLSKHPYFILNKAGMEALFEAIAASDTINNARKLLEDAEKGLEKLRTAADEFTTKAYKSYELRKTAIVHILRDNSTGFDWIKFVEQANREFNRDSTRAEAEDFNENALKMADALLDDLKSDVTLVFQLGAKYLGDYPALAAAAANIVMAEKKYTEKIAKLAGSDRTLGSTMGKAEQWRKTQEDGFAALSNKGSAGKSLAERVAAVMQGPTAAVRDWQDLLDRCLSMNVLLLGTWATYLPWEIPLPPK